MKLALQFAVFRFSRLFASAFLWSVFLSLCGLLCLFVSRIAGFPEEPALRAASACQYLAWAVFLLICLATREKRAESARRFDLLFHAESRFETLLELRGTRHVLRKKQENDTRVFFRDLHLPGRCFIHLLLPFLLISVNLAVLFPRSLASASPAGEKTAPPETPAAPESAGSARIVLLLPETDVDAASIDAVGWDAAAESETGFSKIGMQVFLNGEPAGEIIPGNMTGKPGKIRFSGSVRLDALRVKPFDLVCFRLKGIIPGKNEERTVFSDIRFIRVRPFEPKEKNPAGIPEIPKKYKNAVRNIIDRQTQLNRELAAVSLRQESGEDRAAASALTGQQKKIIAALERQIASEDSRRISAGALNQLKRAQAEMRRAANAPTSPAALKNGMAAIRYLSASLKRIAPEISSAESTGNAILRNLENQNLDLAEVIAEVDNLLAELRPETADGSLPHGKPEYRPAVISNGENAFDLAVRSGRKDANLEKIRRESDSSTARTLKQAQEKISALTGKLVNHKISREKMEEEIILTAADLAQTAEKELRHGIRRNAELLAATAQKLAETAARNADTPLPSAEKTADLLNQIAAEAAAPFAAGILQLEKTLAEMEQTLQKSRDPRTAETAREEKKQLLLVAGDVLENMKDGNPEKDSALRAVRNALENPASVKQFDRARQRIADLAAKLGKGETGWKPDPPKPLQAPVLPYEQNRSFQLAKVKKEQEQLAEKLENRDIPPQEAAKEQDKIRIRLTVFGQNILAE